MFMSSCSFLRPYRFEGWSAVVPREAVEDMRGRMEEDKMEVGWGGVFVLFFIGKYLFWFWG